MKKLLLAVLLAPLCGVFLCQPAAAQKTKAQLTTEVATTFPDNTVGGITPAGVRAYELDVLNSIMPTAPVTSGNLACFSGTTGLLQDCGSAPGVYAPIANPTFTGTVTIPNGSVLNTPTSVTLTNATGLPVTTGISGLGANVATALGTAVGSAGGPVTNGGGLGTPSSGVATNLTGTASGLTAGNVTTNANLTGPVTSVGNATTIANNQITRAMEAQGVARSVIGVTGNATANVADIQGTANQALVVNSAGTALAFGQVNLASSSAVTGALPVANGGTGDTGSAWSTFTPSPSCGTATIFTTGAKSKTIGKTMFVEVDLTITTLGTCTSTMSFTLPATAQSGGGIVGREYGVSGKGFVCDVRGTTATATCSLADFSSFANTAHAVASGVFEIQ